MEDIIDVIIDDENDFLLDDFTFYTTIQGRQFVFSLEDVVELDGKTYIVFSMTDTGKTEFLHAYELITDSSLEGFLDELYNVGKSFGAKEAEAFVKAMGREVEKVSVNA